MREVRWASLDSDGIEHLTLSRDGDGYLAESVIIGRHDDAMGWPTGSPATATGAPRGPR